MVNRFSPARMALIAVFVGVAVLSLPLERAHATDQADLSTALSTLPLLTNKLSGSATMAIVYDPANADSKADAEAAKMAIGEGFDAPGGVKVTSVMVPLADIGSKMSQAKLVFMAKGGCTDAASAAAASAGALTISTDLDCVKSNRCVLGIVSKPNVEIYYSKVASDAANINFARAFTMLVKKI